MSLRKDPIRFFHLFSLEVLVGALLGYCFCVSQGWTGKSKLNDVPNPVVVVEKPVGKKLEQPVALTTAGDQDGDGMPDTWETANFLNPQDPEDASIDFDADGLTSLEEYLHQKNPLGVWEHQVVALPTGLQSKDALYATAINGSCEILVNTEDYDGNYLARPYLVNPETGVWTEVAPPNLGGGYAWAHDLNDQGTVALEIWTENWVETSGAFRFGDGSYEVVTDSDDNPAIPYRLNNYDDWIGFSLPNYGPVRSDGSALSEMDAEWLNWLPADINDLGVVLGTATDPFSGWRISCLDFGDWFFSTGQPGTYPGLNPAYSASVSPAVINEWIEFAGTSYQSSPSYRSRSYIYDGSYHESKVGTRWVDYYPLGLDGHGRMLAAVWNHPTGGVFSATVSYRNTAVPVSAIVSGVGIGAPGVMTIGGSNADGAFVVSDNSAKVIHLVKPSQDADGDGMSDDWEDVHGLNKNSAADANVDADGDGTSNLGEFRLGSNPNVEPAYDDDGEEIDLRPGIDTDGDGIPNVWEWQNGLDYEDPGDAALDFDYDSFSNLQEFRLNTDPNGAPSFQVRPIGPLPGVSSFSLSPVMLGSGAVSEPGAAVEDSVYFFATPSGGSNGGRRPVAWSFLRPSPEGEITFHANHGNQNNSGVALAANGAAMGTYYGNPMSILFWSAPDSAPITLSGAASQNDIAYLGNAKFSPGATYLVATRSRASNTSLYELVVWKMPQSAGQTIAPVVLTPPAGASISPWQTLHVNDQGYVAANCTLNGVTRVVIWRLNEQGNAIASTTLGAALPGSNGQANVYGISNGASPFIVGTSSSTGGSRATVWKADGTATDLGALGGSLSYGLAISPNGKVGGYARVMDGGSQREQPFLAEFNATASTWVLTPQGPPGHTTSLAAVTDYGQILGKSRLPSDAVEMPVLWSRGRRHALDSAVSPASGYRLTSATSISPHGAVLAIATKEGASSRVLLVPDRDVDGDGMPDDYEELHGFDAVKVHDAEADSDSDGLSDLAEYRQGTDPRDRDTDGDGMWDAWEVQWGLLPLDPSDADRDPDKDTLSNLAEFRINTSPTGVYRVETRVPAASSFYPGVVAADDEGGVAYSDGNYVYNSVPVENDLVEDSYSYGHFVMPPGAAASLPLPGYRSTSIHDPNWSAYWQTEDSPSFYMDPVGGVVNASVYRYGYSYDGFESQYFETHFLVPDAVGKTSEEDWIPWSEIQEDLGPYEVDYGDYDENGNYIEDIVVYPGELEEGEELYPYAYAVSPNGKRRVHTTSLGEWLVLNEYGGFQGRLPNSVSWQRINDQGSVVSYANRSVPAANGVPAYQAPEITRRTPYGPIEVISVPHTPGVTTSYSLLGYSEDEKVLLRQSVANPQGGSSYKFFLFDLNSKVLTGVVTPGDSDENVFSLSQRNGYLLGSGTKSFVVVPDGTCLRTEALRVRTAPGAAHVAMSAAGYRSFGPVHVASDGRITMQVLDQTYQSSIVQLVPDNDADGDGMADDWEKYWGQVLLATLPAPDPATTAVLQSGNLDPNADYQGNGTTAGSSFFSFAESEEVQDDRDVTLAIKWRRASGGGVRADYSNGDVHINALIVWEALNLDPNYSQSFSLRDDEIPEGFFGDRNAFLRSKIEGDLPWGSIPLYPGGWGDLMFASSENRYDEDSNESGDFMYFDTSISDQMGWLWRFDPIVNPTMRYFVERRTPWVAGVGEGAEYVEAVHQLNIQGGRNLSDNVIEVASESGPETAEHVLVEPLVADLEVLTPDINIASPEGPPSHRKISLFASPLKDGTPAGTPESDTPAEEVYVDAFDRSLKFNTSFSWIPQGSSELPLGVTLSYNPTPITVVRTQTIDLRTGKPNGYKDSFGHNSGVIAGAFGAGFSSNLSGALAANAELASVKDPVTGEERSKIERYKVDVVDSDGVPHRFVSTTLQSFQKEPGPVAAAAGQDVSLAWEDPGYTHLVLTFKHGKKCRFQWNGPSPTFPQPFWQSGGYTPGELSGVTIRGTARLAEVHDRFGNKLVYEELPTGRRISHFHKDATQASGAIEIAMSGGLVSSITDPRNQVTRFYYETKQIGQTALKLPVLTKVILPDGGVRSFGMHLDYRRPQTHNPALPEPDPGSIFTEGNLKPRKKKKWLTDDSIESAVAPYLNLITDPSGRTTQFSYDEPTTIDSAQRVRIKGTVDFSDYEDMEGNEVFTESLKNSIIAAAKLEASPDIVEEMAERGYFKLPTPREEMPDGSPYQNDPYNAEPYENAEGIYFRSGLMSVPAVKKVVSSDINGDGSPEVVEISQEDNMLEFLTTPNGSNPDVTSGIPGSQQQAQARPQVDLRVTTVSDGIGSTTYRFGDALIVSYSAEMPPAEPDQSQIIQVQPQLDNIPESCHMAALVVRKLKIERAGTQETYYFNPRAGMALDAAIDASGNMTRYFYAEPYPQAPGGAALTIGGVAMPAGDTQLQKYHSDPNAEVRFKGDVFTGTGGAEPVARVFSYTGPYRLQTRVVDERGVVTVQELKDNVLRRLETVYPDANPATLPIRQEEWKYDDPRFPSFVTEHRIKKLGSSDPAWVTDIVKQYEADANGRIWKEHVVLPTGNLTTTYTYDANGNKTTVTTPRGLTTGFIYDSMNRIERIVYQDLTTKQFRYDKAGRKVAEIDENGYTTTYRYSPGGFLLETRRHMADDDDPTPDDLVIKSVFDSRGRVVGAIDANGNRTTTEYDALDRPVRVVDAMGGESLFHYDLTKNAGGSIFSSSSFKPTRTRDASGYVTEVTYNYRYLPEKVAKEYQLPPETMGWQTRPLGPSAVTETVYDNAGNATDTYVKRHSGAALGSDDTMHTQVIFDRLGRPVETVVEPNHPTLRHETETKFTSTGLAWKTIEFRNITVLRREFEREFDAAGREVKAWAPPALSSNGNINKSTATIPTVSALTQTAYDADGNVVQVTDPLGRVTDFHYDNRNRKWKEELPAVEDFDQTPAVMTRPVIVSSFDAVGNVLTVTDARGTVTRSVYDRAYRATHAYAAFGAPEQTVTVTQYDRNGNTLAVTDQNGNTTRNAYDALNRLIGTSVNPSTGNPGWPTSPGSGDIVVANVHDAKGNLVAVADGSAGKTWQNGAWVLQRSSGHVTEFDYDGMNRKVATRWDAGSSLQKQETSSHDAVAMVSRTDAANRVTQYAYDTLFRLTTTTYVGDSSQNHTRYYKGASAIPASGPGPQLAVHYGNGSDVRDVTYALNRLNQVTSEKSGGVFHYYNYDIAGNRLLARHCNKSGTQIRAVVTEYDALNRAKKIHETTRTGFSVYPFVLNPATDKTTQYAYDLSGNTRFKSVPNGQRTTTSYDRLGRKLVMSTLDSAGGLIAAFDYSSAEPGNVTDPSGYDNAGNVRRVVETYSDLSTRTVSNDYDCTHRLTRETLDDADGEVVTEYRYDAANNRIEKEVEGGDSPGLWSFTYGDIANGRNTNQLVSYFRPFDAATLSFTYDAHGNRAERYKNGSLDADYEYDRENRLLNFESYGSVQRDDDYVYDFRSRRVVRDESGASDGQGTHVQLSFSGGTSVQEYAPGATNPTVEYIRGSDWGGGVGGILYSIRGGVPSYNVYNSRGDVVSRTDSTGDVTWQAAYEAFGTRTKEVGSTQERQTANTKDEDLSGLLNEGMRYRDLEAGIFLTRDPAGFVDGPNTYTYVRQNPWTSFDPLGLWGWKNLLSTVLDCVPVVSTVKSAVELVAGRDVITGEPINRAEAAVSLAASFTPGGKMAVKAAIKGAKLAEKATDAVDTAETAVAVAEAAATGDVGTIVEAVGEAAISRVGHRKKGEGGDPSGASQRDQRPANEQVCENEGCFVAGTPVHTPDGLKPIEAIEAGDRVWAYNLETEQWEVAEVAQTFTHSFEGSLVTVNYDGGSVVSTDNHPFWVVSGDDLGSRPVPEESGSFRWSGGGTWVCAGDLRKGDVLLIREGDSRTTLVASLDVRAAETTVYNFEVRGLHNYAVASDGILVHNSCTYNGGAHKDVSGQSADGAVYKGDGKDSHHMPDRNADAHTSDGDGPAIQMDRQDHKQTSSWGSSKRAAAWRSQTKSMVEAGDYRDAMAREIRDVRRASHKVSGNRRKYNEAMQDMLEYDKKRDGGEDRYKKKKKDDEGN